MQTIEEKIKQTALKMGADSVGIAANSDFYNIVPKGYRPDDLLKGAKSVLVIGKRRYTTGQWMTSNTDIVHRARSAQGGRDAIGSSLTGMFESEYGHPAIFINPGMFDTGMLPPISLKVCAELARMQ